MNTAGKKHAQGDDGLSENMNGTMRVYDIVTTVWNRRMRIAGITILFMVVSVVYALMLSNKYTATATILPETPDRGVGQLAQVAGIMSIPGLPPIQMSETDTYPALMKSETILRDVLTKTYETEKFDEPVDLITFWEIDGDTERERYQRALQKIRDEVLSISIARDTRVILISVETTDPGLSANIANTISDKLDTYILTQRRTRASQQRRWLDLRLEEVRSDLMEAEEMLKDFRVKNRRIVDSPELLMEQERLIRDVELHSGVFLELTKQHEMIKVQEIRDMPVVQILDYATAPVTKSGPGRMRIVFLGTVFGLITGLLSVYGNRLLNMSEEENKSLVKKITTDVKNDIVSVFGGSNR